MNPHPQDEESLQRLTDGECDREEAAAIEGRLKSDPAYRALYRRMCDFESSAEVLFERRRSRDPAPVDRDRRRLAAAFGIAAAFSLLAVTGALLHLRARADGNAYYPVFSHSAIVAGSAELPNRIVENETLVLEEGHFDLSFQNGMANVMVESPAKFRITSNNSFEIHDGKFRMNLGSGSAPVRCVVGGYLLEDIGTEFGFSAAEGKLRELTVFEGRVRLTSLASEHAKPRIISAGNSMRIINGGIHPMKDADRTLYRKGVARNPPRFVWDAAGGKRQPEFDPDERGSISVSGNSLVFSANDEGNAWLNLPAGIPGNREQGYMVEIEAALPVRDGKLHQMHSGISLFQENKERIFLGKQLHDRSGWVATVYPESGSRNESKIFDLGILDPSVSFRIIYRRDNSRLSVEGLVGGTWKEVWGEKTTFQPTFDRIRLTAIESSFSLQKLRIWDH